MNLLAIDSMTSELRLTMSDVVDLTGYSEKQLRNFCDGGIIVPLRNGKGPGQFRLYSVMQAVALAYSAQWAHFGNAKEVVTKVAHFIADYSEDELLAEFEAGRTHLIPCVDGPMELIAWPESDCGEIFDLRRVYDRLKVAIEKFGNVKGAIRLHARGRRRGLASSQRE